jgi:hypothetical protein
MTHIVTVAHTWHATLVSGGKSLRLGGVDALPEGDMVALIRLVSGKADAELGSGNWQFADASDPYKLNAHPASDHSAR